MEIVKEGSNISNNNEGKYNKFNNLAVHNKLFALSDYDSDDDYQSQYAGSYIEVQKSHNDFDGLDKNKAELKNKSERVLSRSRESIYFNDSNLENNIKDDMWIKVAFLCA